MSRAISKLISVPSANKLLLKTTSLGNFTHAHHKLEKTADIREATTCFPTKWRPRNERGNSILIMRHYQDLGSACEWLKIWFIQSQELPRSGCWYVISMEFLRTFLRRHFAGNKWQRRKITSVFSWVVCLIATESVCQPSLAILFSFFAGSLLQRNQKWFAW